jgi:Icc-related predicted phosphoesterase
MLITFISDTHTQHRRIKTLDSFRNTFENVELPGGDILIHSGDFMGSGYSKNEAENFFKWYDEIIGYDTKIFIAGNHDRIMEIDPSWARGILTGYKSIEYLQDELISIQQGDDPEIKIWGSPWQPEFYNWAFNLPRNGDELKYKWDMIPEDIDILITHGPAWGFLDDVEGNRGKHLGCELLSERIKQIKPKIHVCGHIHSGYGHYYDGNTHFINASLLDESYLYTHSPWNIDWNPVTNEIKFLK